MSDDELYRRYLNGDRSAGDELMLRYGDALTAYLDGFLHDPYDAEDMMLDCFTVILVDRPKIREGNFRAYLFKVARNKANRIWRLRFRRQEFSLDAVSSDMLKAQGNPEDDLIIKERGAVLMQCLDRIAPQYREALWLAYLMDLSNSDIAAVLGCNTKKVENLLYNGKKQLRLELEKEGIKGADI